MTRREEIHFYETLETRMINKVNTTKSRIDFDIKKIFSSNLSSAKGFVDWFVSKHCNNKDVVEFKLERMTMKLSLRPATTKSNTA